MIDDPAPKPLIWVGSSRKDFSSFPPEARSDMGYALYLAQCGGKHRNAKPLSGFVGAGIVEIVGDYRGDAYRTVYAVRFASSIYVLHAFQKKSKKGIATPKGDLQLIERRLRDAQELERGERI
jgi:phage-related protein